MSELQVPKIALVTLDYPPAKGGVARYLSNLVKASQGEIQVFVDHESPSVLMEGVKSGVFQKNGGVWQWSPLIGFLKNLFQEGYREILLSHVLPVGTAAWLVNLMTGLKYTVIVHGLDLELARQSWKKRMMVRLILKRARFVIANSEYVAGLVKALAPSSRIKVLTPGVESISFSSRTEASARLGISAAKFFILAVARLIPRKGIDVLIRSMVSFPEATLVVIGDGEDFSRLQHIAQEASVPVQFIQNADDEMRNDWYAAADVFALPVRQEEADIEGFGIVYLEAALAGLPVIAGKSGGAQEAVIDHETGLVVEPTIEGVTAALKKLLSDADLRQRFGRRGRERARSDFDWSDRWNQLKKWLS